METFYNPDDNNVNIFKSAAIPKKEKKDLVIRTLRENKTLFYNLRKYLHFNYYYFVVRLFTDKGDEDTFREITREVCKDIVADPTVYNEYGDRIDLFANTFLSTKVLNESPFNLLSQSGKFDFLEILLDCLKEYKLNKRMDVSTTDNYSKTLVDYAIENNKESVIRVISEKYGQDFNFDLTKKSKHGKTMDEIIQDKWSPLVKALKENDFGEFEENLEKVLNGEEEGLPEEDRVDSLGFTFIHSLCLVTDYLFLDAILHAWDSSPQKVKDTLYFNSIDEEMNKYHKQSGQTPITSIFSSAKKDMVEFLFSKIFLDRLIKIDLSVRDGRGRNLLHHIINNRNLDNQFKLEILNKNIAVLTEGLIVPSCKITSSDLFNQLDHDGFSPLTSFVCQLTNKSQKDVTNQLILEFLIERTNFSKTIFDVKSGALIHPFIPCIQLNLDAVYNKLLAAKPELSSTIFF